MKIRLAYLRPWPELEERMAAAAQELLSEGGDDAYPILGYIVQWNIEGRGNDPHSPGGAAGRGP